MKARSVFALSVLALALIASVLACGSSPDVVTVVVTATSPPRPTQAPPTQVPPTRVPVEEPVRELTIDQWVDAVMPMLDDYVAMADEGAVVTDAGDVQRLGEKWLPIVRRNLNLMRAMIPPSEFQRAHNKMVEAFEYTVQSLEIASTVGPYDYARIDESTRYLNLAIAAMDEASAALSIP